MRTYLSTLHKRPHHHKQNFALAVSGGVTLLIFAIWALVMFGNGGLMASAKANTQVSNVNETSPMDSLRKAFSQSGEAVKDNIETTGKRIEAVTLEPAAQSGNTSALNLYGQ